MVMQFSGLKGRQYRCAMNLPVRPNFRISMPVRPEDIRSAYGRIAGYIRRTPILQLPGLGVLSHQPISLKLEFLQVAGSFKARGAFNNMTAQRLPAIGVTAASGGNHGAAVAYAAGQLGVKAHIFVPEIASPAKIARIRKFGAEITVKGAGYDDAFDLCIAYARRTGALNIHAFDTATTIAGQGTVALEWAEDLADDLEAVLVAVGGGGLIAGIASWFGDQTRVIGVEPAGSCALYAALQAGRPVEVDVASVAADSLGARRTGELVFEIARSRVDRVVLVEDAAIRAAQQLLWNDFRLAVEPGGATALAAVISGAYQATGSGRLGVLLCGANVDLNRVESAAQEPRD
jgi:threonine dehydratase